MTTESIRVQIAEGQLDEAIQAMLVLLADPGQATSRNQLLIQSNRLKRMVEKGELGLESSQAVEIAANQVTAALLSILDQVDKGVAAPEEAAAETEPSLLDTLSAILGRPVEQIPNAHKNQINQQLQLYRIHQKNLDAAEQASAKWGELAPPIILHRISEGKAALEQVVRQLNAWL